MLHQLLKKLQQILQAIPGRPGEILSQGEALTGLEVEAGGGKIRLGDDPSRTMEFLILRRGAHWSGLEAERSVSGLDRILILRRGAHWAGGGKIRLEVERSVSEMIRRTMEFLIRRSLGPSWR